MGIPCADAPQNPQQMREHPPKPPTEGKNPHMTYQYPQNIPMHREAKNRVGGANWREGTPIQGRCKESVQHVMGPLTTPHNMQKPQRTYICTEEYGEYMGVYKHTGGHMNAQVAYKCRGVQTPPK